MCGVYAGFIDTDMAAQVDEAKVEPQQVAARTLAALQAGQSHILADDAARDIRTALQADPHALETAMQRDWDQGESPWSI